MKKLVVLHFFCPGHAEVTFSSRSWHKAMKALRERCDYHKFPVPTWDLSRAKEVWDSKNQTAGYQWSHEGMTLQLRMTEYNKWSI